MTATERAPFDPEDARVSEEMGPDLDPVLRCILELVKAVDQQPVMDRLEAIGQSLSPEVTQAPLQALSADLARQNETLKRELADRLQWLSASVSPRALERAVQRSAAPIIERLEQLSSERAADPVPAAGPDPAKAVNELRRLLLRELAATSRSINAGLDSRASAAARDRVALAEKLDGLFRALEHVELDVGSDMSRITVELVGIRDQLAKLSGPADLESLIDRLRELGDGSSTALLEKVQQIADSLYPEVVINRLDAIQADLPDLAPVLQRLDTLRSEPPTLDLLPVLEQLAELRSALPPAADLGPVLERVDEASARIAEIPRVDLAPLVERIDSLKADFPQLDLQPVLGQLAELEAALPAVDLAPLLDRIEALKGEFPQLEVQPLMERMAELRSALPPAVDLGPVLERVDETSARIAEIPRVDLGPVLSRLDSLSSELPTVDLGPVIERIEALKGDFPRLDLQPVLGQLAELRRSSDAAVVLDRLAGLEAALPPAVDLGPVLERLDEASARIAEIPRVDLAPVVERIEALKAGFPQLDVQPLLERLDALQAGLPAVDLGPVLERLDEAGARIAEIPRVDLAPVLSRLDSLGSELPAVDLAPVLERIESLKGEFPQLDLQPVLGQLAELRRSSDPAAVLDRLNELEAALPPAVDLGPVLERLEEAGSRIAEIPRVDLAPVLSRLDSLGSDLPAVNLGPVIERIESLKGEFPRLDLQPVLGQLAELRRSSDPAAVLERLNELEAALPPAVDLGPVLERLEEASAGIAEIPRVDLAPVVERIEALKGEFPQLNVQPLLERLDALRTDLAVDLKPVMGQIEELKTSVDPTVLIEELGRLRAALDPDQLAGKLEGLLTQPHEELITAVRSLPETLNVTAAVAKLGDVEEWLDDIDLLAENLQESIQALPEQLGKQLTAKMTSLDKRLSAAAKVNEEILAGQRQLLGEFAQLANRMETLEARTKDSFESLTSADAEKRQEVSAQLAEMSDQIVALRRRIAVRIRLENES